jgi:hypothetical protein
MQSDTVVQICPRAAGCEPMILKCRSCHTCALIAAAEARVTQEANKFRQNQPEPVLEHPARTGTV